MIRILVGDVRERLADLPDGSVQCVVTSPPYFGLRDYGTASWAGGDPACDHRQGRPGVGRADGIVDERSQRNRDGVGAYGRHCRKCGAVRVDNQIGLEPTLAEYIDTLVHVFREVRRVLRDDGTVWLNLGDSYAAARGGTHQPAETLAGGKGGYMDSGERVNRSRHDGYNPTRDAKAQGLKHKDLMMVPARVALALQDDGWWLRSDIIWAKKNCMPESVTDRPTSSHEHIFLLTKRSRYFYDAEAVREASEEPERQRWDRIGGSNGHTVRHSEGGMIGQVSSRNQRNVWHLATEPFPDAHFATFPSEIPRRCIKAGTSEKGQCAACGAPWVRVVERPDLPTQPLSTVRHTPNGTHKAIGQQYEKLRQENPPRTTGWRPSCNCDADVVPQVVLDPFLGSGTTLLVADQLGRDGIGIELNQEYSEMSRKRITNDAPMFVKVETT